ncbi:GNAT family N-acetyltransferase [Nocardioides jishulii]|uniref:N-acetyltransferase n=1 Tax=Nocardioides jishulii TaxID=2575440 RepID=A0A4U2YVA9_9ACTN|nr:GNAT family N-acetyltransferase [Nocardioides jishulii]QCX26140.1 N-acetyltransferase [Nocardioides jishulii]TKI64061.1 N-acetyltransferase [Nocardioides jishulii]
MTDNNAVSVNDALEADRYEIHVAGELAGFADYRRLDGVIDFLHTEVFDAYEGRGLAKELATASLNHVRQQGMGALPHCAFYRGFIQKNPEYVDLVPEESRAEFGLA